MIQFTEKLIQIDPKKLLKAKATSLFDIFLLHIFRTIITWVHIWTIDEKFTDNRRADCRQT